MRLLCACLVAIGSFVPQIAAFQTRGDGAAAAGSTIRACSLLTRELAMKVSGAVNKVVFDLPPEEEPLGRTGSACHYADITFQIDPFTPERLEELRKSTGKDWEPMPGVGDVAYFRNNGNRFAELLARVGRHTFTVQLGVPFQGTAEAMKPNLITFANAIAPRLR